jgi:hypothetical protein
MTTTIGRKAENASAQLKAFASSAQADAIKGWAAAKVRSECPKH